MKCFNPIQQRWLALVCLSSLVLGCSGGDVPSTAAVKGKVTVGGRPVSNATVLFHPAKGPMATGLTDSGGNYTMLTGAISGVTIGKCKVTVSKSIGGGGGGGAMKPEDMMKMQKAAGNKTDTGVNEVPASYGSPDSSPLEAEVTSDTSKNVFDFTLNG